MSLFGLGRLPGKAPGDSWNLLHLPHLLMTLNPWEGIMHGTGENLNSVGGRVAERWSSVYMCRVLPTAAVHLA